MISNAPLVRHLAALREALSRLKSAAGEGASINDAVRQMEAEVARLGEEIIEQETHLHYQRDLNPQIEWIADAQGSIVAISGRWERLTGMTDEEAMGQGWRAIVHPEDAARYDEAACAGLRRGTGYDVSFRGRTADGGYRWLRARAAVRLGPTGELLYIYGYTEDVHEQVLAARALRESEENLRYTIELNPQLPFRADADGNVVEVSTKWMQTVGSDIDALLGLGSLNFIHPDDVGRIGEAWARAIRMRGTYEARYRMRQADGSYRWFQSQAGPRLGEGGEIVAWYGVAEDIDDHVRAEEATAEAVERYRLAARATNDVIYDWDVASGEIQWNEAMASIAGTGAGGFDWWDERVHPADRDRVVRSLDRFVTESSDVWRCDYRFRRVDGSWGHIYDRAHLLRGADGAAKRVIGCMSDLTQRDEAEQKVQQLRAELIHVSRLSAMGAMAATLAHELNQPLAAAHNWLTAAQALVAKVPDVPADALEALGEGRATILRAGEIIRRMRKLVAGGNVTQADEELGDIVEEAQSLLKDSEGDQDVVFEVDVPVLHVLIDRVQIQQVLLNLMRNALEATRHSGERRIRVAARADGTTVEVVVSDTGTGLAEGFADELFTPFRTTKSNGLGVGLSICRTIVEAHGGRIWLTSDPGSGTSVHFTIPGAAPVDLAVPAEEGAAHAA